MSKMVKSCPKLEAGIRFGPTGITACCCGAQEPPNYWDNDFIKSNTITKEMLVEARKKLFKELNTPGTTVCCATCPMMVEKPESEVTFDKIGFLNIGHFTYCNLRCEYCAYTQENYFVKPPYNCMDIINLFGPEDVYRCNGYGTAWCDFNGGEPTMLPDFDEHLATYARLGIGISLFTNAVRFSQKVYDGIKSRAIEFTIVSLDAGTPETFKALKGRDHYQDVVDNLAKYVEAGAKKYGKVCVKYIFHDKNCSDADIDGFVAAMERVRPFEIWLNMDFYPLSAKYPGQAEVGVYDYSEHIKAYAKMYLKLKAAGLPAIHYVRDRSSGYYLPQLRDFQESVLRLVGEM